MADEKQRRWRRRRFRLVHPRRAGRPGGRRLHRIRPRTRSQVDSLRSKTIELSGSEPVQRAKDVAQRARQAVSDPEHPVGKAIQDGVAAAKRKREELEASAMRKMQQPADGKE